MNGTTRRWLAVDKDGQTTGDAPKRYVQTEVGLIDAHTEELARFIAAAPKVLRALERAVPFLQDHVALTLDDGDPSDRMALDATEMAITEAGGQA